VPNKGTTLPSRLFMPMLQEVQQAQSGQSFAALSALDDLG
jgi:hypothetical protein